MRPDMLYCHHVRRGSRGDLDKKVALGHGCSWCARREGSIHFGIFLRVHYGGDGDAEVGDWAPEIC